MLRDFPPAETTIASSAEEAAKTRALFEAAPDLYSLEVLEKGKVVSDRHSHPIKAKLIAGAAKEKALECSPENDALTRGLYEEGQSEVDAKKISILSDAIVRRRNRRAARE